LGCGRISQNRNTFLLTISKFNDIEFKLLPIFDNFNLNTTKYLNYLAFKKGFLLYKNRTELSTILINEVIDIKNFMNDKRTKFSMVNHQVRITGKYLLGLIEGDSSFYLYKKNYYSYLSIGTETVNRLLLEKIRDFLISKMDINSRLHAENTKLITIIDQKAKNNKKPFSILQVYQIDYIYNQLLPFFDNLEFHTKKFKDYEDFKILVKLIYQGKHLISEGSTLIYFIANRMNDNRLTTNINSLVNIIDNNQIKKILDLNSIFKKDSEGRVKNILNNNYVRSVYIIEASLSNGETFKFHNAIACAKALNINNSFISRRLNDGQNFKTKKGLIKIRRLSIYNKLTTSK
jgi:hypothetical protein